MTFIQPKKNKNLLNRILIFLGISTICGSFWLVLLYNKLVNLDHGLSQMKSEFAETQSQNLAIKNRVFDIINAARPTGVHGLIQEKNPEYIEIPPTWSFASDY